jgi:hypothetical protein
MLTSWQLPEAVDQLGGEASMASWLRPPTAYDKARGAPEGRAVSGMSTEVRMMRGTIDPQ